MQFGTTMENQQPPPLRGSNETARITRRRGYAPDYSRGYPPDKGEVSESLSKAFQREQYDAIKYPNNAARRYNSLLETFIQAAKLASEGDVHTYKRAKLMSKNHILNVVQQLRRDVLDESLPLADIPEECDENLMVNFATSPREPLPQARLCSLD